MIQRLLWASGFNVPEESKESVGTMRLGILGKVENRDDDGFAYAFDFQYGVRSFFSPANHPRRQDDCA